MHSKRFVRDTQNRCEKNPTIVNFPIKNLDMRDFCTPEAAAAVPSTRYDLVANVCHEGSWEHGVYARVCTLACVCVSPRGSFVSFGFIL
jgi:U4/U6.U5 tri-snRNP-associated protein 2